MKILPTLSTHLSKSTRLLETLERSARLDTYSNGTDNGTDVITKSPLILFYGPPSLPFSPIFTK